jgi:hypothetical protein
VKSPVCRISYKYHFISYNTVSLHVRNQILSFTLESLCVTWNEALRAQQSTHLYPEIAVGFRKHEETLYVSMCSPNAKAHEGASHAFHDD